MTSPLNITMRALRLKAAKYPWHSFSDRGDYSYHLTISTDCKEQSGRHARNVPENSTLQEACLLARLRPL
jgi:hypothetical protein